MSFNLAVRFIGGASYTSNLGAVGLTINRLIVNNKECKM